MNDNIYKAYASQILDICFPKNREHNSDEVIQNEIKTVLINLGKEEREIGRKQIISYVQDELNNLKKV